MKRDTKLILAYAAKKRKIRELKEQKLADFLEKFISLLLKVRRIKFFLRIKILSLLFLIISTPTPKICMLLNNGLKFFNYIF